MGQRSSLFDASRQAILDICVEELAARHRLNQACERRTGGREEGPPRHAPHLGDLLADMTRLGLQNVRALARLHHTYSDLVIDFLLGCPDGRPAEPAACEPVLVQAGGAAGETAEGRFLLCNSASRATELSLRASEVREQGSDRAFRADISFDPTVPRLPPGGEVVVVAAVKLGAEFVPGHRYTCHVDAVLDRVAVRSFVLDISVRPAPTGS